MSKYQCLTCTKNFKQKSQLDYHKNRKNKCKPLVNEEPPINTKKSSNNIIEPPKPTISIKKNNLVTQNNTISAEILPNPTQNILPAKNEENPLQTQVLVDSFPCEHCKKCFVRKDVLAKHIKRSCPVIKQQNKEKQDILDKFLLLDTKYKELEEKNKQIEEKNKELKETVKNLTCENKILQTITINNNNNNSNNITNNNNTININIVSHGDEKLLERQIGELMLMVAAKKGVNIVDELINLVHFNPTYPQFQNIYLPDMKNNHMMVYEKEWIFKNATTAIKELCDDKSTFIIDNINAIFNRLTIREQSILKTWLVLMSDKTTDEYKEYYDILLDKIKYNLFNKKAMVIATKKQSLLK